MRLSGVFDTIFTISKRKIANYVHRRVREASKTGLGTSVWVKVGACAMGSQVSHGCGLKWLGAYQLFSEYGDNIDLKQFRILRAYR